MSIFGKKHPYIPPNVSIHNIWRNWQNSTIQIVQTIAEAQARFDVKSWCSQNIVINSSLEREGKNKQQNLKEYFKIPQIIVKPLN